MRLLFIIWKNSRKRTVCLWYSHNTSTVYQKKQKKQCCAVRNWKCGKKDLFFRDLAGFAVYIIAIDVRGDTPYALQPQRRSGRRLEQVSRVERADLCTHNAGGAAIIKKAHERIDRVDAVNAAAFGKLRQKRAGNAGKRAVGKSERQRGVENKQAVCAAYPCDAAAAIGELRGQLGVAKDLKSW